MKKVMLIMFSLLMLMSCNKEAVKKVTAIVLAENVSTFVIEEGIIVCVDDQVLRDYVKEASCKALKVDCSDSTINKSIAKKQKSKLGKSICESSIAIVAPALFPTHYLPLKLKEADCKAVKLDYWLSFYSKQVCEKL